MTDFTGRGVCTCGKEMNGSGGSHSPNLGYTYRNCECGIKAIYYTVAENHELSFKVEHEDKPLHDLKEREKLMQCFNLANIKILDSWDIKNGYHGQASDWLLIKTKLGLIKIGWRKRVINIDWSDTKIELIINDNTTADKTYVHAWSYAKAVDYLERLVNQSEIVKP